MELEQDLTKPLLSAYRNLVHGWRLQKLGHAEDFWPFPNNGRDRMIERGFLISPGEDETMEPRRSKRCALSPILDHPVVPRNKNPVALFATIGDSFEISRITPLGQARSYTDVICPMPARAK